MAMDKATRLDRTFQALADPTRRGMLALVARRGECVAGELGAPFAIAQPSASKHIAVLERAGLLVRRVEGRSHRFRLATAPLDEAEQWIARHRSFWEGTLARLADELPRITGGRDGE
jgi:DNA-binding transcriptional ArsR family regulator